MLERANEKDEKEAKKKRRLVDDFTDVLKSMKECCRNLFAAMACSQFCISVIFLFRCFSRNISVMSLQQVTASSIWEEGRPLLEDTVEFR
ncbi:hypothetical protein R1flu_000703 [Riccia fluitans]|uniref:Uncharacterized protein n=1 Tax=Riccia fluitans TaxID=41844 RepID=A0ABD1Y182_9MARC